MYTPAPQYFTNRKIENTLFKAVDSISDYKGHVDGSFVNWSSNWSDTFTANFMAKIREFIEKIKA
jgi:hypothetical protein